MRMKRKEQEFYSKENIKTPVAEYEDAVNHNKHPPKLMPLFAHKRHGSFDPRNSMEESDIATNVAANMDNTVENTLQQLENQHEMSDYQNNLSMGNIGNL